MISFSSSTVLAVLLMSTITVDHCVKGQYRNYMDSTCNNDFEDISAEGTEVLVGQRSGQSVEVALGFDFPFFGDRKTDITISVDGFLTFGSSSVLNCQPDPIPSVMAPNDMIAPLLGGLENDATDSSIHYYESRDFTAQWTNLPDASCVGKGPASTTNTFQAVLFGCNGCIEFRYDSFTVRDFVAGIENDDGTTGVDVTDDVSFGGCISICPEQRHGKKKCKASSKSSGKKNEL